MAAKVGLLDHHQYISEIPERVKRSTAETLVRRLLAVKIGPYLYQRLAANHSPIRAVDIMPKPRTYIPEHLPANIDAMLGVIDQSPSLTNQIRFRHVNG